MLKEKTTGLCDQVCGAEYKEPTLLEQMEADRSRQIDRLGKLEKAITLLKTNPEAESIYKTLVSFW